MLIEDDDDHEKALARIEELWGALPETPEGAEFEKLVMSVVAFEEERYPFTSQEKST